MNKVTVAATATVMLFGSGIASGTAVSAAPSTSQGDTGSASSLGGNQISTGTEEAGPAQMAAEASEHADLLGQPTGDVTCVIKDNGCYQAFKNGALFFSPSTGAQPVVDKMWQQYRASGFENGPWGYPIDAPVVKDDGSVTQRFQGGVQEIAAPKPKPKPEPQPGGNAGESASKPADKADQSESPKPEQKPSAKPSEKPAQKPSDKPSEKPKPKPSDKPTQEPSPAPSTQAPKPSEKPAPKPAPKPKPKPKPKPEPKPDKPKKVSEAQLRKNIIKDARKGIGTPYVWGGTSPSKGWDCSGFTQYVYKQNGISIPRVSGDQRRAGKEIKASEAKPGDLIWAPGHIGIVSDKKGKMIDAGSKRTGTSERSYSWMVKRGAKFIRYI